MSENIERAIRYLTQSPLLHGVEEEVLRIIDPPPEMIFLKAGETLIRQSDDTTDYFVLVSGRLQVFKEERGRLQPMGVVLPGEGIGEIALLTNEPHSATVIARLDSELVRFAQSTFLVLAAGQPLVALTMARAVIFRLIGSTASRRTSDYPAIAILPLTPDVDTRSLARDLALELARYGRSRSIDPGFTGVLDEVEEQFDFVVYAALDEATEWSRTCLLRADLILCAAGVTESSEPSATERQLIAKLDRTILGRVDLLLVHPHQWHPQCRAHRWLDRLSPQEYHHVRRENASDLARIARIIVSRANNVVLSGGGARAFAQLGVIRALKEFKIPLDRFAGSSMGAAVGAMAAFGDGFDNMVGRFKQLFYQRRPERDLTLPLLSLMAGKKMADIAIQLFQGWNIEDLPTRYFCISSDLGSGEILEHGDGPLWQGLRATAAMPVVAPPFLKDGRVLVDGGVLNNLPIDIMRRHFTGPVIAIDVSQQAPLVTNRRWDLLCPSGFEILRHKLTPYGDKVGLPSIFEVLRRTITLASERQAQLARPLAELLITPPVTTFGVTEFTSFDRIVDIGYKHAVRVLAKLTDTPNFPCSVGL